MHIKKFTATGRPLDPDYLTNRIIMVVTAVIFVGGLAYKVLTGTGFWQSLGWGFGVAMTVFFSWALCREFDPDHDYSAFVAAGLTGAGVFFFYPPSFVGTIWLLLMIRMVNRSTGLSATIADSIVLSLLSAWFTFHGEWIYGLITVMAFYIDGRLPERNTRQVYFAIVNALIWVVVWIFRGFRPTFMEFSREFPVVPVLVLILLVPFIVSYRNVRSKGDNTGITLDPVRVIISQILAVFAGLQILLQSGYATMLPLYGAITGAILFYFATLVTRSNA